MWSIRGMTGFRDLRQSAPGSGEIAIRSRSRDSRKGSHVSRPHAVGGFDEAASVVEKLAVARVVGFLDPLDMGAYPGMLFGQESGEVVLLLRRADDQDRACVRDRLGDILEERLVLLDP